MNTLQLRNGNTKLVTTQVDEMPLHGEHGLISWYMEHHVKPGTHTESAKEYDFQKLLEFFAIRGVMPYVASLCDVASAMLEEWIVWLRETEAPATVNRRLATIKHFCAMIHLRIPFWPDPAASIKGIPLEDASYKGIDEIIKEQIVKAAYSIGASNFFRCRSGLTLELLAATGLRAQEVLDLTRGHVSPDRNWLRKVRCKGGKIRNLPIRSDLAGSLECWLPFREDVMTNHFPRYAALSEKEKDALPLLPTLARGGADLPRHMDYKTLHRTVAEACKRADSEHINPHRFRHAMAHLLLDSGVDIRMVAQALGHSDTKTTMRYTERGEEKLAAAFEKGRKR